MIHDLHAGFYYVSVITRVLSIKLCSEAKHGLSSVACKCTTISVCVRISFVEASQLRQTLCKYLITIYV
jgi:hypothetical protein